MVRPQLWEALNSRPSLKFLVCSSCIFCLFMVSSFICSGFFLPWKSSARALKSQPQFLRQVGWGVWAPEALQHRRKSQGASTPKVVPWLGQSQILSVLFPVLVSPSGAIARGLGPSSWIKRCSVYQKERGHCRHQGWVTPRRRSSPQGDWSQGKSTTKDRW